MGKIRVVVRVKRDKRLIHGYLKDEQVFDNRRVSCIVTVYKRKGNRSEMHGKTIKDFK